MTSTPADVPTPLGDRAPLPRGEIALSLVIPVLDERGSLPGLLEEIERACAPYGEHWEAVFVDDGSRDGSGELLASKARADPRVRLVKLRRNFGKSAALRAGFAHARGEEIVTLDADGQDDPAEIPALLAELRAGADIVSGWKRSRRDPPVKRASSRVFNKATALMSGVRLHDFNCGLKAYRGECARSLEPYGEMHRYMPVIAAQRGWRVSELPVNHRPRTHGRTKFGPERYARGLLDLITVLFIGRYQQRPLHLFGGLGLLLMTAGLVISAYLTALKLIGGAAIGGRPLLILGVLLIVVGFQLLTFGLLGEMIAATRQDVRRGGPADVEVERVVDSSR